MKEMVLEEGQGSGEEAVRGEEMQSWEEDRTVKFCDRRSLAAAVAGKAVYRSQWWEHGVEWWSLVDNTSVRWLVLGVLVVALSEMSGWYNQWYGDDLNVTTPAGVQPSSFRHLHHTKTLERKNFERDDDADDDEHVCFCFVMSLQHCVWSGSEHHSFRQERASPPAENTKRSTGRPALG